MLDLARLERLKLVRRPLSQRFFGHFLGANYRWLPGIELIFENDERIPDRPVVFAMNHTDRYNYFPFQYKLWKRFDRFTATWVKGKYYESRFLATFMESMLQLPTVSRGYLITRDFVAVLGRTPTDQEYSLLRAAVDARAVGEAGVLPSPPDVPELLLRKARNPFGIAYDPADGDYADYICALFHAMMARFVELNGEAIGIGLDLLVFPQGTRSKRLLPAHSGLAQVALHLGIPIVPVGCNGCDKVYPGGSPVGRRGRIVYRIGQPIPHEELAPFHIQEPFAPFSAIAERDFATQFQGVSSLVTDRIDALLDPEYQRVDDVVEGVERGARRFI
jgi:1-acyl-sn-glycerol-3-phosphate acyltransferase